MLIMNVLYFVIVDQTRQWIWRWTTREVYNLSEWVWGWRGCQVSVIYNIHCAGQIINFHQEYSCGIRKSLSHWCIFQSETRFAKAVNEILHLRVRCSYLKPAVYWWPYYCFDGYSTKWNSFVYCSYCALAVRLKELSPFQLKKFLKVT